MKPINKPEMVISSLFVFSRQIFLFLPRPVPAPVPRCSPFIFINKLAEWTNIWSDSNPYFPVPPCEYGGPLKALASGDLKYDVRCEGQLGH